MKDLSMIPYLEPGEGIFHLNMTPSSPPSDGPGHSWFPFRILDDTDPFSRLFDVEVVSGPGRTVLPLFLLVQSNHYRYTPDQLRPLNNKDLEHFWRQTHACVANENNLQNRFFPLAEDSNSNDLPAVFRPLFFCSHHHRYFHPPCPACGNLLDLCRDDGLLTSKGLSAYSTSLKRYLYCPGCKEHNEVYAYDRAEDDPPIVKNRGDLIRSWRNIVAGKTEARNFPCTDCPEQIACFGETALSDTRIIPFLFYPSPVLVFGAASLSAADFLAMVSGATLDDIISDLKKNNKFSRVERLQAWRRAHGNKERFLFPDKAELFLEILYLKLTFLSEVSGILLAPGGTPVPIDIFTSLDALWVNLPDQNGLLPCFWNFTTNLFTAGPCGPDSEGQPEAHPSRTHACLGIIWFFALLRNKHKDVRDLKAALDSCLDHGTDFSPMDDSPLWAPFNNFWDSGEGFQKGIPEPWKALWTRSLSLGLRLLQDVFPADTSAFVNSFQEELEDIRREIKEALFHKQTVPAPARPGDVPDVEIHRILSRISDKWQRSRKTPPVVRQPEEETLTQTPEEETLTQTIVISGDRSPSPRTQPQPALDDGIQETVILKKGGPAPEPPPARPQASPKRTADMAAEEEMQETVILKEKTAAPGPPSTRPLPSKKNTADIDNNEDDLAETFILKPSGKKDLK